MAKTRVYELARALNMDNKTLLEKLNEMDISVQSHMSSLDEETINRVKVGLLGKSDVAMEETRIKPGVIRRRKRVEPDPMADTIETTPGVRSEIAEPAPEVPPIKDTPEQLTPAQEQTEETPVIAQSSEANQQMSEMQEVESVASGAEDSAAVEVQVPEPDISETQIMETELEAPSISSEEDLFETTEAVEFETQASEVETSGTEAPIVDKEELVEAAPMKNTEKEVVLEATEKVAGTEATDVIAPTGKAEIGPIKLKTEKPSKKVKKSKKETPAKIIKLPTRPVEQPDMEETEIAGQEAIAEAVDETLKTVSGKAQPVDTPAEEVKNKKPLKVSDKKKKKKVSAVEKEDEGDQNRKFLKKKISFKRKEVVESDALYDGVSRSRKPKKGAKAKPVKTQKPVITIPKAIKRRIKIDETIILSDLAKRMGIKANEMIGKLMSLGIMATVNQTIDFETAALVAVEFGYDLEKASFEEETILKIEADDPEKLVSRPPVVTIMGHVDHGKTSLLDVIRKTRITEDEAGGITQHIGAYLVPTDRGDVVFLDTPGHEAFTAMRARGAKVTDIVILVVAADDGVMPQTIEAINHAKASEVPIIVAINKIDKANAEPDRVQRQLAELGLSPEEWGGETIYVKVSAKQNEGIDELLEMILLQSEIMELQADANKHARGHLIEAKLDSGRGPVATVLVQEGTLRLGDVVVCGVHHGRIRAMLNDLGQNVDSAGPSIPVEILGLAGVPMAGDEMISLEDEKDAKMVSSYRMQKQRNIELAKTSRLSLDKLFERMKEDELKDLNIIIKADVIGSLEALKDSLDKLSNEEVKINVVHGATGTITESDVSLAAVSNAIIIGFNVRPAQKVIDYAQEENVDMRFYNVIYNVLKDVKDAIVGMMSSTYDERVIGRAEVRETFTIPKVGTIAGCYVTSGKIERGRQIRLIRDGIVGYEGKISSLKRYKDDQKEVQSGYECGIGIENYNDIKIGDVLECYYLEEIRPELD